MRKMAHHCDRYKTSRTDLYIIHLHMEERSMVGKKHKFDFKWDWKNW